MLYLSLSGFEGSPPSRIIMDIFRGGFFFGSTPVVCHAIGS